MPIIEKSAEQHEIERREEVEDLAWAAEREDTRTAAKYAHELQIARLKAAVPKRHQTIQRGIVAVAKMPALVILAIMLPLVYMRGKEIPASLADFMDL